MFVKLTGHISSGESPGSAKIRKVWQSRSRTRMPGRENDVIAADAWNAHESTRSTHLLIEQTSDAVRPRLPRRRFVVLRPRCAVLCPGPSRYDPGWFSRPTTSSTTRSCLPTTGSSRVSLISVTVLASLSRSLTDRSAGRRSTTTLSSCN